MARFVPCTGSGEPPFSDTDSQWGKCPECGQRLALDENGTMRPHLRRVDDKIRHGHDYGYSPRN